MCIFFFNDTATTEIYTLSLHDALPILLLRKSLTVLGVVILAFFLHGVLHLEAATIAIFGAAALDRKSTRLNSSHANISYAVFCLKKKNCTALALSTTIDS